MHKAIPGENENNLAIRLKRFIAKRLKPIFYFGFLILFLLAIQNPFGGSAKSYSVAMYAGSCSGLDGYEKVIGKPDLVATAGINKFNETNSVELRTLDTAIICDSFKNSKETEEHGPILSVRLNLSWAKGAVAKEKVIKKVDEEKSSGEDLLQGVIESIDLGKLFDKEKKKDNIVESGEEKNTKDKSKGNVGGSIEETSGATEDNVSEAGNGEDNTDVQILEESTPGTDDEEIAIVSELAEESVEEDPVVLDNEPEAIVIETDDLSEVTSSIEVAPVDEITVEEDVVTEEGSLDIDQIDNGETPLEDSEEVVVEDVPGVATEEEDDLVADDVENESVQNAEDTAIDEVVVEEVIEVEEAVVEEVVPEDTLVDLLSIFYSTDNISWVEIAKITDDYFVKDFVLPIKSWDDLDRLKIKIAPIDLSKTDSTIYLDGMAISVKYGKVPTPEEIEKLPKREIKNENLFKNKKKGFRADEEVKFQFDLTAPESITKPLFEEDPVMEEGTDNSITIEENIPAEDTHTTIDTAEPISKTTWTKKIASIFKIQKARAASKSLSNGYLVTSRVIDPVGNISDIDPVIVESGGSVDISVPRPKNFFRPGLYKLHTEIVTDTEVLISEEDFTWGVLAINVDKSIYTPNQYATIQMAVLNDVGHTLCDADLQLVITEPDLSSSTFFTANGGIGKSGECGANNVTDNPDYLMQYFVSLPGTYELELTNLNNGYSVIDSFDVQPTVSLTVRRVGATRINPFISDYTMSIFVTANSNATVVFEEVVPSSFGIYQADNISRYPAIAKRQAYDTVIFNTDSQTIQWSLDLKAGKTVELAYTYDAPNISPQLFLLGPSGVTDLFTEDRQWQLASDAACSSNGTGNWNTGSTWSGCTGTGGVPAAGDTITISDGHTVTLDTDATVAGLTLCDSACSTDTSLIYSGTRSLTVNGTVLVNGGAGAGDSVNWAIGPGTAAVSGAISYNPQATNSGRNAIISITTGTLNANGGIVFENTAGSEDNQMLQITDAGRVNLKGAISNLSVADIQPGTTSIFSYADDASAQTVVFDAVDSTYANLYLNNTSGSGATLGAALTATNTTGNLVTQNGLLDTGGYNFAGTGLNTLEISNGAQMDITGASAVTADFASYVFNETSTLRYLATPGMSFPAVNYGNFVFSPQVNDRYNNFTTGSVVIKGYLQVGGVGAYTGTIVSTQANTASLDVWGDTTVYANATLSVSATAGTTFGGNLSNSGTLTHNSGTVTFYATDTGNTIDTGSSSLYDVIFDGSGGEWSPITSGTFTVDNDLTLTNGTINSSAGSGDVVVKGSVACGASCGTITLTAGTFTQNVAANKNFGTNVAVGTNWSFNNLTLTSSTGTPTITTSSTGTGTITAAGTLTIGANTTLDAANRTWILSGMGTVFTKTGTLTPNTSTFQYKGDGATTVAAATYTNLTLNPTLTASRIYTGGGAIVVTGNLTMNPDAGSAYSLTFNLGGALTGPPTVTVGRQNSATAVLDTTGSNYGITAGSFAINAGGTLTGNASSITSNGAVTIASSGTLTSTSGTLDIKGDYTNNGTFTHSSGTVTISGSSQQTLAGTMTGGSAFNALTITNASGSDPDTSPSVIFSASATATTFTAITASTKIRFAAGSTYAFTNISLNGQGTGTRVQLRSSSSPSTWALNVSGSQTVLNTNPKDSNAGGGNEIDASDASNLDGTGNNNWNFGGAGSLTVDIVDSGGTPVGSPSVAMSGATLGFSCQTSTGTLGTADQKIRADNSTAGASWTMTIAATGGATSEWDTGAITYDYNDSTGSGCTDGIDGDSTGGQLTLNPSAGTIAPQGGCTDSGLSKGGSAAFAEGSVDIITLLSATGAETGCYWDLTGVSASQTVPADQLTGSYAVGFTITIAAS